MKVSFFPGCSLEGTAREYGESIEAIVGLLGVELEELPDWSCCGASSAHSTNEFLSVALPARNLNLAEKKGQDLITPCAACFSRLKAAEKALTGDSKMEVGIPFQGEINILHILEFLSREDFSDKIEKQTKKPLEDLKVLSYYGCLLTRPPRVTGAKNWEDPQDLDKLISKLGGKNVFWPYKTECCGGSLVLTNLDIARRLIGRLLEMAKETEADCIVTACPLCQANVEIYQDNINETYGTKFNMPVVYYSTLLSVAFGRSAADAALNGQVIPAKQLEEITNK